MCTKIYDQMMYGSWDMVCDRQKGRWTDGWMDEQKKWYIEVGALPKNDSDAQEVAYTFALTSRNNLQAVTWNKVKTATQWLIYAPTTEHNWAWIS